MKSDFATGTVDLVWTKAPGRQAYELSASGPLIGALKRVRFSKRANWPENERPRWLFRRVGSTDIEILEEEGVPPVAYFKANLLGGGKLSFIDGEEFRLAMKGLLRPVWSWRNDHDEKLFKVIPHKRTVAIKDKNSVQKLNPFKFSILAMLSWHQVLRTSRKARAAVATGTPAT